LFGLVSKDGRKGRQARWGAILALFGVIAVWGLRDHEHRRALSALEARTYQGGDPVRASAYPHWWNPFQWYGVVEMTNFFATTRINSSLPQIDPEGGMKIVPKPEESPVTLAAKQSYLGRAYLDWAQYPVTETEQVDSPEPGYVVHFKDLRYDYPLRTGRGVLGASVGLDSNLNVASESIGSRTRRP
jgi:inner membrane protein